MDVTKLRIPLSLLIAAVGLAAGSGGTWALASSKQEATAGRVDGHGVQIQALEKEQQANRERVLRIELLSEQTSKTVERIERKLDRADRDRDRVPR